MTDTSQDGTTDQAPAQDKALIPSSFGMTFSVDLEVTEIDVSAAWGQYIKENSEYPKSEKTGNPTAWSGELSRPYFDPRISRARLADLRLWCS